MPAFDAAELYMKRFSNVNIEELYTAGDLEEMIDYKDFYDPNNRNPFSGYDVNDYKINKNDSKNDRVYKDINRMLITSVALRNASYAMAKQKTTERFIKDLLDTGYDAVEDYLGRDVAVNPIIVLNPDENLKVSARY